MTRSRTTLRLRKIQPRTQQLPESSSPNRLGRRVDAGKRTYAKHSRKAWMGDGSFVLLRMTDRRPWTKRAQRRARNKVAKQSRRVNR